ncbi:hypothetical protein IAU60_001469 [Kwoniella sp. DSM 27419]
MTYKLPSLAMLLLWAFALQTQLVSAQFGFFQQGFPFGGHHGHHHAQQQEQNGQGGRAHRGYGAYDEVHCRVGYVCPSSLACVPTPADCPCPHPEDIKCVIPDERDRDEGEGPPFICTRGDTGCDEVVRFAKAI